MEARKDGRKNPVLCVSWSKIVLRRRQSRNKLLYESGGFTDKSCYYLRQTGKASSGCGKQERGMLVFRSAGKQTICQIARSAEKVSGLSVWINHKNNLLNFKLFRGPLLLSNGALKDSQHKVDVLFP